MMNGIGMYSHIVPINWRLYFIKHLYLKSPCDKTFSLETNLYFNLIHILKWKSVKCIVMYMNANMINSDKKYEFSIW